MDILLIYNLFLFIISMFINYVVAKLNIYKINDYK